MRAALTLLALMSLTACVGSMSEKTDSPMADKQKTILGETAPGLGDLWAPTKEEKADDAWWGSFYGHKTSGSSD